MNYVISFDALNNRNPRPCSHYVTSSEGVINAVYKNGIGASMQCSPILLKIDMHVRYTMMHVLINPFCFKINIGMVPTSNLSYKIRF